MDGALERQRLADTVRAMIARALGRHYRIDLTALDVASLREFLRLLRDVEHEKQLAAQQARLQPWRR